MIREARPLCCLLMTAAVTVPIELSQSAQNSENWRSILLYILYCTVHQPQARSAVYCISINDFVVKFYMSNWTSWTSTYWTFIWVL
jgi:hypothetical protein